MNCWPYKAVMLLAVKLKSLAWKFEVEALPCSSHLHCQYGLMTGSDWQATVHPSIQASSCGFILIYLSPVVQNQLFFKDPDLSYSLYIWCHPTNINSLSLTFHSRRADWTFSGESLKYTKYFCLRAGYLFLKRRMCVCVCVSTGYWGYWPKSFWWAFLSKQKLLRTEQILLWKAKV